MHPRVDAGGWHKTRRDRAPRSSWTSSARAAKCIRARWTRILRTARVTNYWGGSSSATTHLLDHMHYRGLVRVTRREKGIRIYAARASRRQTPA